MPADTTQPVVRAISFEGNTFFSDRELRRRIRMLPNRQFLSIPGFTWWRWVYQLGDAGTFGKRIGNALKSSGEPPAYLNAATVRNDVERLEIFYEQQGFRKAAVSATVRETDRSDRVRVVYRVEAGTPTHLRTVRYEGLDRLTDAQKQRLARGTVFDAEQIDSEQPLQFHVGAQRYTQRLLLEERQRMLTFLRNEGYARVARDSIRALVYEPAPDSFDVTLRVQTGHRYRFGDVHFQVVGLEDGAQTVSDTLDVLAEETATGYFPIVSARVERDRRLRPSLLRRSLQFEPGAIYDRSQLLATKRRLESTGIFTFTNIIPLPEDTTVSAHAPEPFLAHRIELRTRPRHRLRAEMFMLQRSEVLPGAENELGTGVGFTYENANLLGGGETLRLRTSGSIAADFDSTLFSSAQTEVTASLTSPYLIRPFDWLDDALNLYNARTRVSLSLLRARRDQLGLNIGRSTARLQLEMQHTPTVTSLVDVFDLSLSNPDPQDDFREKFLDRVIGTEERPIITDPVQRAQIVEDYERPQINTALRYTLRAANANPLRRERGYSYEMSTEIGSTVPYLIDRFVTSPDTLEGKIPGLPFLRGSESSRLVYRPYVRFVMDLRRYKPLSRGTVLAAKFIGGLSHPVGRPNVVPFDRRFYAGGASSVRGWGLRELGPGRSTLDTTATSGLSTTNVLGGDVKLEGSLELRTTLLREVLAANWMGAAFVDAGNVWFGPRNPGDAAGRVAFPDFLSEIGVGTGVGLRFVWDYLIVRLDLAYRVHDPLPQQKGLFPDGLRRPQLHFGIGHAF